MVQVRNLQEKKDKDEKEKLEKLKEESQSPQQGSVKVSSAQLALLRKKNEAWIAKATDKEKACRSLALISALQFILNVSPETASTMKKEEIEKTQCFRLSLLTILKRYRTLSDTADLEDSISAFNKSERIHPSPTVLSVLAAVDALDVDITSKRERQRPSYRDRERSYAPRPIYTAAPYRGGDGRRPRISRAPYGKEGGGR